MGRKPKIEKEEVKKAVRKPRTPKKKVEPVKKPARKPRTPKKEVVVEPVKKTRTRKTKVVEEVVTDPMITTSQKIPKKLTRSKSGPPPKMKKKRAVKPKPVRKKRIPRPPKPKKRFGKIIHIATEQMDYLIGREVKILPQSTEDILQCIIQSDGYEGLVLAFDKSEIVEIEKLTRKKKTPSMATT